MGDGEVDTKWENLSMVGRGDIPRLSCLDGEAERDVDK